MHNEGLPELKSFVLPGGSEPAARLHVARAVCRRAELAALAAASEVEIDLLVLVYLNRLSDLLFILARAANAAGEEPLWRPGRLADRPDQAVERQPARGAVEGVIHLDLVVRAREREVDAVRHALRRDQ